MKIGVINYSIGNVGSVLSALKFYDFDAALIHSPAEIKRFDIIILAGVGNFMTATAMLRKLKFQDALNKEILIKKKPILGICLGMQLFAEISYEDGTNKGFGWIKGKVVRLDSAVGKIPHIGWDEVKPLDKQLFQRMKYRSFYFMHSYHFIPENSRVIAGTVRYGSANIVAAVKKGNIFGVQFHPEKSQGDGLRFLANFIKEVS